MNDQTPSPSPSPSVGEEKKETLGNETPTAHKAVHPTPQNTSTLDSTTDQDALQVKIAELCPNAFVHVPSPFGPGGIHWREGRDDHGNPVSPGAHVDPLSDLNACHEFEKGLTHEQGVKYRLILMFNSDGRDARFTSVEAALCHATAEQRCRAFVALHEGTK